MNNWLAKRSTKKSDDHSQHPNQHQNNHHHHSHPNGQHRRIIRETCIDEEETRSHSNQIDPAAALDTFKNHWLQATHIMSSKVISQGFNPRVPKSRSITFDDVTSIVNHIDQMVALLLQETGEANPYDFDNGCYNSSIERKNPLLEYMFRESILDKIFCWSCDMGEFTNNMKLEQLKIYELLLSKFCHGTFIFQQPIIRPLHKLLATCRNTCPLEVEKRLVVLLNTICVSIGRNNELLEFFYHPQAEQNNTGHDNHTTNNVGAKSNFILEQQRRDVESRFLIFSLLISFVHREGAIGQQARDGLLQIMPITWTNESLSQYIATDSNLCPVMATILSGLYSSLPRKLNEAEEFVQINEEDIQGKSELQIFLSSLDFCNAVVQVSHPLIKKQMMDLIYQGFLLPVLGPALHEEMNIPLDILENSPKHSDTIQQIITTTAYLELCLRRVTEPALLRIFLKFICVEKFDDQRILNTLIGRIQARTKLSLVSLVLFRTIIDLDCEDVILELILKYLIDSKHVSPERNRDRAKVNDSARFLMAAQKFLTLLPKYGRIHSSHQSSCNNSSDSPYLGVDQKDHLPDSLVPKAPQHHSTTFVDSYLSYLDDAHCAILRCKQRTHSWMKKYEAKPAGTNDTNHIITPPSDSGIYLTNSSSSNNLDGQKLVNDMDLNPSEPSLNSEAEMIGPFLSNLLSRLSQLPFNDIHINLQITGLIARLAIFSDCHIRSFLLDCDLRLHKNVRSLFSMLSTLKKQLEEMSIEMEGFAEQYIKAKNSLIDDDCWIKRHESIISDGSDLTSIKTNSTAEKKAKKRRSLRSYLPWVSNNSSKSLQECPSLESLDDGYKFINKKNVHEEDEGIDSNAKSAENKRIIYAAIVFEEIVKELAAIAQEQYILADVDPCLLIDQDLLID